VCVAAPCRPGNILLSSVGAAKIADFGISKMKAETYLTHANREDGTVSPWVALLALVVSVLTPPCCSM